MSIHPSRINLSSIPGVREIGATRTKPEPTVANELRTLAYGLYGAMKGTAESFAAARSRLDAQRALRLQDVYDAQRRMFAMLEQRWKDHEFAGNLVDWEVPHIVARLAMKVELGDTPF